jgi:arsenate reductase
MAEAFLRTHGGDRFEAYSAGCAASEAIHPYTVQVMEEIGIDIRTQYPKDLREYMGKMHFGYVVTVCARAEKDCPRIFLGMGHKLTWFFDDPRAADVPKEQQLQKFQEVRDEIERKILYWLDYQEEELAKLRDERERERRERLADAQIEAKNRETLVELKTEKRADASTMLSSPLVSLPA